MRPAVYKCDSSHTLTGGYVWWEEEVGIKPLRRNGSGMRNGTKYGGKKKRVLMDSACQRICLGTQMIHGLRVRRWRLVEGGSSATFGNFWWKEEGIRCVESVSD